MILAGAMPASAAELPSHKAGLWEIKTSPANPNGSGMAIQHCIDASSDQMMQSSAGPGDTQSARIQIFTPTATTVLSLEQAACSKRDVQKSANGFTIDSTCTVGGKTEMAHKVITGSFDSAYTMIVTSESDVLPGGKMTMTTEAKWLGPCAADQDPGDMIMANGLKVNIREMLKRGLTQGLPLPR